MFVLFMFIMFLIFRVGLFIWGLSYLINNINNPNSFIVGLYILIFIFLDLHYHKFDIKQNSK